MNQSLIDEHRAHYDTLVLGYLKDNYGLLPADSQVLTDCEPVREAHRHAVAELQRADGIDCHLLAMARAIAGKTGK